MDGETLTIELGGDHREAVARLRTGDTVSVKAISVSDLVMELSRDLEITTGVLPGGTKFYSGTKKAYRIGIQIPARIRTAKFNLGDLGEVWFTVPFPETLFVFGIRDGRIVDSALYSCVPPIGRPQDWLYFFPFGNVYVSGNICWGSVAMADIKEPVALDTMVARFFGSVFSGHLVNGTSMFRPPDGVVNLRTLLEHLSGQESFPDGILKISDTTVGMAMSNRRKG